MFATVGQVFGKKQVFEGRYLECKCPAFPRKQPVLVNAASVRRRRAAALPLPPDGDGRPASPGRRRAIPVAGSQVAAAGAMN